MRRTDLTTWTLLAVFVYSSQHAGAGFEEPAASSWLEADWSEENQQPEQVTRDKLSGCICRFKPFGYVVCYGGMKCSAFPRNLTLPAGIADLRLKTTAIGNVSRDDLRRFQSLKVLMIDANNHLDKIEPGTFQGMVTLRNLSISYNSDLKILHPDTFLGLTNLETLRLAKNGFQKILDASQALQTHHLPNLLRLSLSENSFPQIDEKSFAALTGTNVVELELILCQVQSIAPGSLNVFRKLTTLRLGDNLISEEELGFLLQELNNENISVRLLNLYNLGFRKDKKLSELLGIISNLNVSHLILSRNHLESISADLFPEMLNLEVLDLREVSAVVVEPGALSQDLFPNLKVLLLAGNKLSGILPGVILPQISFLDLSENSGGAHSPSYFDVSTTMASSSMLSLKSLDLSFNRISTITKTTFQHFDKLRVLGLKNATLFYVSRGSFLHLKNLQILNLESNPFKPFNQFNVPIFDGLVNLESLYLGYCEIVSFNNTSIFKNLSKLKYLNLQENELMRIEPQLVLPLVSLVGIDASENRIQPWTSQSFKNNPNLKIAILSSNRLSTITAAMMEDFVNLTRVDISHNAYFCDCWAFNQTMEWLLGRDLWANQTAIASPNHVCSAPEDRRDEPVATFLDSPEMCLRTPGKSIFTTPVYVFMAAVAALSICLGVFAYVYRWHIRYWIFLARMAFIRRHGWILKKNKVYPGDYKYDVFVSYSHEDRNFIVRLVAMLENQAPFLKLCVYERDFEIGTIISDTVMEKVAMSRRTLLVVSNSFAKSQWCMWELQLAESHRLFFRNSLKDGFKNDPLVMIKLGPIAETNMTPTLKFLLKSRIYLEWNHEPKKQVGFWEKLRATLTPEEKKCLASVPNKSLFEQ